MQYYHNPRCRKSREGLALLEEKGISPQIKLYLEEPPTAAEITALLKKLKLLPAQLLRKGEPAYKENVKGKDLSDPQLIKLMAKYPKLIERPILIKGGKAIVGRPPEKILELL